MNKRLVLSLTAVVLIGWTGIGLAQQSKVPSEIRQKVQGKGVVRVIVHLNVSTKPEGELGTQQAVFVQRQEIAAAQDATMAV